MDDAVLRKSLGELLKGGHAHVGPKGALSKVPAGLRTKSPGAGQHSVWDELEHMRLAQEDILRYALDPAWRSPEFPSGYWPAKEDAVTDEQWSKSLSGFLSDLEEARKLVEDSPDLTAVIPHGEGRTYLRQILLIADHNAYHLGQIVQIRKALGNWSA